MSDDSLSALMYMCGVILSRRFSEYSRQFGDGVSYVVLCCIPTNLMEAMITLYVAVAIGSFTYAIICLSRHIDDVKR